LKQDFAFKAIYSIAIAFTTLLTPNAIKADEASIPGCHVQPDLVRLVNPLARVGRKLAAGAPITIVAIG